MKIIRVLTLMLALTGSAYAGEIQNPITAGEILNPVTSPPPSQTTQTVTVTEIVTTLLPLLVY